MGDHKYNPQTSNEEQTHDVQIPDAKGYDEQGNCNNCGKSSTGHSKEYKHPSSGSMIVDVFCTFCGSIVEVKEIE